MRKKILSIFLCVAMCFTTAVPVFAAEKVTDEGATITATGEAGSRWIDVTGTGMQNTGSHVGAVYQLRDGETELKADGSNGKLLRTFEYEVTDDGELVIPTDTGQILAGYTMKEGDYVGIAYYPEDTFITFRVGEEEPGVEGAITNITTSPGSITFDPDTASYTVTLPEGTDGITVTATWYGGDVTIDGNALEETSTDDTSVTDSYTVDLTPGVEKAIPVVFTPANGSDPITYTINVKWSVKPGTEGLVSIGLANGITLNQKFDPSITRYSATVPNSVESVSVVAIYTAGSASYGNGINLPTNVPSDLIPLVAGRSTTIEVVYTNADGGSTTYYFTVYRDKKADDVTEGVMTDIQLSEGTLSPAFSASTTAYTATVDSSVESITVKPIFTNGTATVEGANVTSGMESAPIALKDGENVITVVFKPIPSKQVTYTITVTRGGGSDEPGPGPAPETGLTNLALSAGSLDFHVDQTEYGVSVANSVDSITVTPTFTEGSITINGVEVASGVASAAIPLDVGANVITAVYTPAEGDAVTYTITVTRAEASTPTQTGITNISLSAGTMTFDPATTSYTVNVANSVAAIKVTPTYVGGNATVNGTAVASGAASNDIALAVGSNTITVVYTPEGGAAAVTYTINVVRAAKSSGGGGGGGGGSTTYSIAAPTTDGNGTVTVSRRTAPSGASVKITVTPNTGYELDDLVVTDADGNEITLTDNGDGTYSFTMPARKITSIEASFVKAGAEPGQTGPSTVGGVYNDVQPGAWYYDAVMYATNMGYMNGMGNNMFEPETPTTRAMLVTVIWRMSGSPVAGAAPFSDIPAGQWYSDAVGWASSQGVVLGFEDGTFRPNIDVTREQYAAILYRYAGALGLDTSASAELAFTDASSVSAYAVPALQWSVAVGLINGMGDGTVAPKNATTRAQSAALLQRFDAFRGVGATVSAPAEDESSDEATAEEEEAGEEAEDEGEDEGEEAEGEEDTEAVG